MINIVLRPVKDPINDIPNVKFYSKPSRAWYVRSKDIHTVAGWKGIGIISTSQGLWLLMLLNKRKFEERNYSWNLLEFY
jgi:ribosomal protein S8